MKSPFLVGQLLYLRPMDEADVSADYLAWLNDHEVSRYIEGARYPTTPATLRTFLQRFEAGGNGVILAIVDRESNLHVGTVTLNNIHRVHRTADTGLFIGRREFWGKGYATEAWYLMLDYAFARLNLRKIVAGTIVEAVASRGALTKLGFQVEGTLRGEYYLDGAYRDAVRLGLFREEFYAAPYVVARGTK